MLFCSNWYYCLTAELNQIKTAILIKMTSRSGGRISGRKLFLRGLKTKQLLSQLVPRQIFQIFPTMRWVMGVALVPGFALVFFCVPLVNPPHWSENEDSNFNRERDDFTRGFGVYPCSDKPMLMYMRLYIQFVCGAVYPLRCTKKQYAWLCVFVFGSPTPRSFSDWRWGHVECKWSACLNSRRKSRNSGRAVHSSYWAWWPGVAEKIWCCFMMFHGFHLYLLDRLGISFILGEFSCELMTRKPTSKVDDLRSTYLMKITDVSTNQNP